MIGIVAGLQTRDAADFGVGVAALMGSLHDHPIAYWNAELTFRFSGPGGPSKRKLCLRFMGSNDLQEWTRIGAVNRVVTLVFRPASRPLGSRRFTVQGQSWAG